MLDSSAVGDSFGGLVSEVGLSIGIVEEGWVVLWVARELLSTGSCGRLDVLRRLHQEATLSYLPSAPPHLQNFPHRIHKTIHTTPPNHPHPQHFHNFIIIITMITKQRLLGIINTAAFLLSTLSKPSATVPSHLTSPLIKIMPPSRTNIKQSSPPLALHSPFGE